MIKVRDAKKILLKGNAIEIISSYFSKKENKKKVSNFQYKLLLPKTDIVIGTSSNIASKFLTISKIEKDAILFEDRPDMKILNLSRKEFYLELFEIIFFIENVNSLEFNKFREVLSEDRSL